MVTSKHFEAGNLYLPTHLLSCGFAMKGIAGSGRLKRILFDDIPAVHKACEEFYADSETRKLFDCYRRVKDYLFQNGV